MALANNLISRFGYENGITHMKLQKLVYYAHGWWLAYNLDNPPPLLNERPQVWQHGPVFSSMYHALKGFGNTPIRFPQPEFPMEAPPDVDENDDLILNFMDWIWVRYGQYSAIRLSDMTHQQGTPWRQIAEKYNFRVPLRLPIPDDIMQRYFRNVEASRQGVTIDH
jgi:uncharacterized phage-associated protein